MGGAEYSHSMTDRLVRTWEQDTPQSQTKDQLKSTSSTLTDAKLLHIQCSRRGSKDGRAGIGGGRHTVTVEPMGAQRRPVVARQNLLEYPVTTVGSLGLWSFIAGGTQSGADRERGVNTHAHTHAGTHTETPTLHGMEGRGVGQTVKRKEDTRGWR